MPPVLLAYPNITSQSDHVFFDYSHAAPYVLGWFPNLATPWCDNGESVLEVEIVADLFVQ